MQCRQIMADNGSQLCVGGDYGLLSCPPLRTNSEDTNFQIRCQPRSRKADVSGWHTVFLSVSFQMFQAKRSQVSRLWANGGQVFILAVEAGSSLLRNRALFVLVINKVMMSHE